MTQVKLGFSRQSKANTKISSLPSSTLKPQVGKVYGVVTTENTPTKELFESVGKQAGIGAIFYRLYSNSKSTKEDLENIPESKAFPLFPQIQNIPLIGELVYLIDLPSPISLLNTRKSTPSGNQKYYIPINVWNNVQQNSLPSSEVASLGSTIVENPLIRSLIPYQGDYIIQSRQGSALRFSTTSRPITNPNEWSEIGNEDDPITILTNGLKFERDKPYYIERINKDNSSLYLTSAQKIPLQTDKSGVLNNWTNPTNASDYFNSQAILNADRVTLNSKKDEVMIFATTNVEINTKKVINLNADERVHLNSDSVFLGHYDPNNKPQPMLLGTETINLFKHLISSLASLAGDLYRTVGAPEGSPIARLNTAGTELLDDLVEAINLLEKIPSKKIFLAPDSAIQTNNATPTTPEEEVQFYQASYTPPPTQPFSESTNETTTPPPTVKNEDKVVCEINFDATFDSGQVTFNKISPEKQRILENQITSLVDCINRYKSQAKDIKDISLQIEGGESRVPNPFIPDTEPKQRYPQLSLARARATTLESYLNLNLPKQIPGFTPRINILEPVLGGPQWEEEFIVVEGKKIKNPKYLGKDNQVYKDAQYVRVKVVVNAAPPIPVVKKIPPICNLNINKKGSVGLPSDNFVTFDQSFDLSQFDNGQKVEIGLASYTYPDAMVITAGNKIYNTGFVGEGRTAYFNILLATVIGNTYRGTPPFPFPQNIIPISTELPLEIFPPVERESPGRLYEELGHVININWKRNIKSQIEDIKWFNFSVSPITLKTIPQDKFRGTIAGAAGDIISITKDSSIEKINIKVYSPIGSTIYNLEGKCVTNPNSNIA